jgi:hypothetical protein
MAVAGCRLDAVLPVAILAAATVSGCGRSPRPEQEIEALIATAERAAESRSVHDLVALLAPGFGDADGRTSAELARYLRGYFIAHQSIHLLTRIDEITVPAADVASARVAVAMVGTEAERAHAWNLAFDFYEFDLDLDRIDGDWKVIHAQWYRPGG